MCVCVYVCVCIYVEREGASIIIDTLFPTLHSETKLSN